METKVFVARLRPELKEDYIEAHNGFSSELRARYRAAGIPQIRLFLLGDQLFMYVEAENYELARATLAVEAAIASAALYAIALALFAWACQTAGRRRLSLAYCEPGTADLIVTGPYGLVRHPIYAAYTVAWLAGGIAARSVVLLAGALVMWSFYLDAARREEAWLASTGGARYARYRTAVGMFLPTGFADERVLVSALSPLSIALVVSLGGVASPWIITVVLGGAILTEVAVQLTSPSTPKLPPTEPLTDHEHDGPIYDDHHDDEPMIPRPPTSGGGA